MAEREIDVPVEMRRFIHYWARQTGRTESEVVAVLLAHAINAYRSGDPQLYWDLERAMASRGSQAALVHERLR